MTDDQKRIAIAEACGLEILPAAGNARAMCRPQLCSGASSTDWKLLPDYLNDLNAMAEAEKALTENQHKDFANLLWANAPVRYAVSATAAQRAEAFLKTLNLWTD